MDRDKIRAFLKEYLNEIRPLTISDEDFDHFRYLDEHLDSFEIIQFILAVESEFSVSLTPEMTESEEFRTIGGLVGLIEGDRK